MNSITFCFSFAPPTFLPRGTFLLFGSHRTAGSGVCMRNF